MIKEKKPHKVHPNSLKNLRPCKKGETHNPKGRPSNGFCITHLQRKMLSQPCPYAPGKTWAEHIARRGLEMATESATYYKELLDRLEGKVVQPIGGEDGPLTLKIFVASEHDKENLERVISGERT